MNIILYLLSLPIEITVPINLLTTRTKFCLRNKGFQLKGKQQVVSIKQPLQLFYLEQLKSYHNSCIADAKKTNKRLNSASYIE